MAKVCQKWPKMISLPFSGLLPNNERPGYESYRKTREDLTTMDKLHMALTGIFRFYVKSNEKGDSTIFCFFAELSYSINYTSSINVWEYSFAPREYLNQHLETR